MPVLIYRRDQNSLADDSANTNQLLSEKVYHQFKRDIITGVLEPGLPLTEAFLTKRFGASRTPVREACARLNNEKLLELIPNKGYSVASISLKTIQELFQLRTILEEFTVQEACGKNDPELLGRIEGLGQITSKLGDRESYLNFIDANYNLHLCIAEMAGNQCVSSTLADVLIQLARLGYVTVSREDEGPHIAMEHKEIVDAIRSKDRERAKRAVQQHIQSARDNIMNVFLK